MKKTIKRILAINLKCKIILFQNAKRTLALVMEVVGSVIWSM